MTKEDIKFTLPVDFKYRVKVIRVIDGDSIEIFSDRGRKVYTLDTVRMFGYDAPEINNTEQRERGLQAKARLEELILNQEVYCQTYKDSGDKYGRLLATIVLPNGKVVNQIMINEGHIK